MLRNFSVELLYFVAAKACRRSFSMELNPKIIAFVPDISTHIFISIPLLSYRYFLLCCMRTPIFPAHILVLLCILHNCAQSIKRIERTGSPCLLNPGMKAFLVLLRLSFGCLFVDSLFATRSTRLLRR